MEKSHDYIHECRGCWSEGDYEESGKNSLKHPRMRSNAGRLGATSPSRYPTRLRGEDDKEAG